MHNMHNEIYWMHACIVFGIGLIIGYLYGQVRVYRSEERQLIKLFTRYLQRHIKGV